MSAVKHGLPIYFCTCNIVSTQERKEFDDGKR